MNFMDATKLLKGGHAIRRKAWPEFTYIKIENVIIPEGEEVQVIKGYRQEAVSFVYDTSIIISDDWIVVGVSPEDTIDFPNAVEMLKKRFKIKLKEWPRSTFIELDMNGKDLFMRKMCEHPYTPTFECFCAIDWETVE